MRRNQFLLLREHALVETNGFRPASRQAVGKGEVESGPVILGIFREVGFQDLGRLRVILLFERCLRLLEKRLLGLPVTEVEREKLFTPEELEFIERLEYTDDLPKTLMPRPAARRGKDA